MRYAEYDPNAQQPAQVLGWYNDGHPNPPGVDRRIELSAQQWESRLATPYVHNGSLVQASPPGVVPTRVTPLQARRALAQMGLLAAVNAVVAAANEDVKLAWEYATYVDRADPVAQAMSSVLGLTSQQLDALFTLAATF